MSALIAAFGSQALAWAAGAFALVVGGLFTVKTLKSTGAAEQRATDTQKGMTDVAAASKARSGVDALGDDAVDERLRQFERK